MALIKLVNLEKFYESRAGRTYVLRQISLEIEEGFLTLTSLPGGLLAKVGKMKEQFGKVNTLHAHTLPWIDVPIVMKNFLGGEEGLNDSGLSVSKLLLNPWFFTHLENWERTGDPGPPASYQQRLDLMNRHFRLLVEHQTERFACLSFRKVANWYCKVLKPGRAIQQQLVMIDSLKHFASLVEQIGELIATRGADEWPDADIAIVFEAAVVPTSDNTACYLDTRHFSVREFIGDRGKPGPLRDGSDGVVPYASSHLDAAASELVVPAGHRVYANPAAVSEVKRILALP